MRIPCQIKETFIVIWQVGVVAADECVNYQYISGLIGKFPIKWLSA